MLSIIILILNIIVILLHRATSISLLQLSRYTQEMNDKINILFTFTGISARETKKPIFKVTSTEEYLEILKIPEKHFFKKLEISKKNLFQDYFKTREDLLKEKESISDPKQKERYNASIAEIDTIYNLLYTIDNKSSMTYVQTIFREINKSITILQEMRNND